MSGFSKYSKNSGHSRPVPERLWCEPAGYYVNTVLTVMSLEQVLVAPRAHDDRSRLDTDVSFALQQSSKHGQHVASTC